MLNIDFTNIVEPLEGRIFDILVDTKPKITYFTKINTKIK